VARCRGIHHVTFRKVSTTTAIRREGVGIISSAKAKAAWRAAGELWRAVSSRLIMARFVRDDNR